MACLTSPLSCRFRVSITVSRIWHARLLGVHLFTGCLRGVKRPKHDTCGEQIPVGRQIMYATLRWEMNRDPGQGAGVTHAPSKCPVVVCGDPESSTTGTNWKGGTAAQTDDSGR